MSNDNNSKCPLSIKIFNRLYSVIDFILLIGFGFQIHKMTNSIFSTILCIILMMIFRIIVVMFESGIYSLFSEIYERLPETPDRRSLAVEKINNIIKDDWKLQANINIWHFIIICAAILICI